MGSPDSLGIDIISFKSASRSSMLQSGRYLGEPQTAVAWKMKFFRSFWGSASTASDMRVRVRCPLLVPAPVLGCPGAMRDGG